jgi:ATP-dependent protease ClpP protease subunit
MMALHQGNNDWYRIRNQASGPTQLYIYDEIGYFGVTAMDLVRDLADVTGPLEVHLNSPGGEVDDGIAIYNTLMDRRDVTVRVDGLAASIASVIAMAGNPILVARQASMMVHDGHTMAIGNAQDLRDMATRLERASNNIAQIYSEHTGQPISYWRELMKAESWYTGQEIIDAGLADRFIDSGAGRPVTPPAETWDLAAAFRGPRTGRHAGDGQDPAEPTPDPDPPEPVKDKADDPVPPPATPLPGGWMEPSEEDVSQFLAALKGA